MDSHNLLLQFAFSCTTELLGVLIHKVLGDDTGSATEACIATYLDFVDSEQSLGFNSMRSM